MGQDEEAIYLCPNCLSAAESAGNCPACGTPVLECRPGDSDDPCRRPIIDARGNVRTRAPLWWLRHRVGRLVKFVEIE